ncbi:MAG: efflux RND transporter permease subunit [Deltaproteobacteria bacterium]|nr:MAG: efflux RND transporter permease subunit [Deltaproteobacteria bacterium]
MNISEPFIKRPVMTTLVMTGLLLFGIQAYRLLPVSDLPNVDFPTILVNAVLPGASPETMASAVATPLERQFTTIAGLDSMTSTNQLGVSTITLQFDLSRSIDAAAQDVQAAIAQAQRQLPPEMPTPPSYQKVNPADQPILYLALTSPTLPLSAIDEYATTFIAQRISTVSGVAQVQVFGSQKYAVRIQADPRALAARGIGIDELSNAVRANNVNLPTGTLWGPHTAYTVQANGQLQDAKGYQNIIVAFRDGRPVRLTEIAQAQDSVENDKTAAWYVDERAVVLAIQKQPGTNTVAVADSVKRLLPVIGQQLPASLSLHVMFDRSDSIRASVNDVKFTLLLTLFLVVLVIFLFLRNVSATAIPSVALPMSIVGTFVVMYLLGYSLDNLSLMALTLSVGFVVDDAIVMLENIVRHMEMGEGILEAAYNGSREIAFTIVSMTISLAAVFIPVLFMGGIVGRLFHEFAVTIGAAILVSGFVSLTLTPMLGSRFLRHQKKQHGKAYLTLERGFDAMLGVYERGLKWSLDHRRTVIVFSAIIFIAMIPLFMIVPKGFMPSEDLGGIFGITEAREGISFRALVEHQLQVNRVVKQDANVESFFSSAGSRGGAGGNQGFIFIRLKPRDRRELSADKVVQELRPKLMREVIGMNTYLQPLQPIRIGGTLTKSLYQFTLQDADTKELYRAAPEMEARMRQLPGLQDVTSDLLIRNPQVNVDIDRDKAASQGITPQAIEDALYTAYGSRQVSTIYAPNNEYQVILELKPEFQGDPNAMGMLYIRSSAGQVVPLSSVATLKSTVGPLSVNHLGQLPAVNVSFNLKPGVSLGEAVNAVNRLARQTLPATVSTSFQGTAQAFQSSQQGLGVLLLMAILVIYLVLGILYESFIHPITILSALPLAGFGALVTLLLFRVELSIYAFVGIIMLVGLVKKNGIMMVDFAIEAQRAGKTATEAIYEACVVRFRPIMMTTMAALVGTLPIAMGFGAGAESRRPLGLAVVGGLLFSQMLTLFVTPVTYTYMEQFRAWAARRRAKAEHPPVAVPSP